MSLTEILQGGIGSPENESQTVFKKKKSASEPDSAAKVSPAVAEIVRLLEETPEDWSFSLHYATHIAGARIWIGNPGKRYAWARQVDVPGVGRILAESFDCKPTADHDAIDAAVTSAQQKGFARGMRQYAVTTESAREAKRRRDAEEVRRLEYDGDRLIAAGAEAKALAAEKRKASAADITA